MSFLTDKPFWRMLPFFNHENGALDESRLHGAEKAELYKRHVRRTVFRHAVISMAARVAVSEGMLARESVLAVVQRFENEESKRAIALRMAVAAKETLSVEHYVRRVLATHPNNMRLYRSILSFLQTVAEADGQLTQNEYQFLRSVADAFDIQTIVSPVASYAPTPVLAYSHS